MKDLYYILGTDRDCTTTELNAAYKKLASKLQPDEMEHDHFLEHHFKEITEAYQILSDPARRRSYDAAFKTNYQRRLYYFKIKHLNVAATLVLLLFTGLFGWYVMKILSASNKRNEFSAVTHTVQAQPATASPIVHHRKKHKLKIEAPAINQPAILAKETVSHNLIKPAPPIVAGKAVILKPDTIQSQPSSAYSTNLRANATGVIYLHESPNYTSFILSKIPDRSKVIVIEKGWQFYKVMFEDRTGYVPKWTIANP